MSTKPQSIILYGPQGSGKGTQKKLLAEYLKETTGRDSIYVEPGQFFRNMMETSGYTNDKVREIQNRGGLQPDFLAVYAALNILIDQYTGQQHVFFDGVPRKILQAEVVHTTFNFYDLQPRVIMLDVPEDESVKRLLARGREDDTEESIRYRLQQYQDNNDILTDFFASHPEIYTIHRVNGNQTIEAVFADIKNIVDSN